jgi:hypothetical protein
MVEHTSEVNSVAVVLGIALIMVGAGLAKKQLGWRPRGRGERRGVRLRRRVYRGRAERTP